MKETIEVKWEKVQRSSTGEILNSSDEACVYVFLYNHYPFYVGTAETNNFKARMLKHESYFKTGKRTYLQHSYFKDFSPWTKGLDHLNEETFFEHVFVPDISGVKRKSPKDLIFSTFESMQFWQSLEIFVGKMGNAEKKVIVTLEKNIQLFLFDQNCTLKDYKKLHIPHTISTFFGRQEPGNFMLDYEFNHDTTKIIGSDLDRHLTSLITVRRS